MTGLPIPGESIQPLPKINFNELLDQAETLRKQDEIIQQILAARKTSAQGFTDNPNIQSRTGMAKDGK